MSSPPQPLVDPARSAQSLYDFTRGLDPRRMVIALSVFGALVGATLVLAYLTDRAGIDRVGVRWGLVAVTGLSILVVRRSGTALAVRIFLCGCALVLLAQAALVAGLRTATLVGLPGLMVIAGWFMRPREAIALGVVSMVGVAGIAAAEHTGLLAVRPRDLSDHLLALLVVLTASLLFGLYAHRQLTALFGAARDAADRLADELAARERAEHQTALRNRDLRLVHRLSERVHPIEDRESILRIATETIVDVTRARAVTSYLLDETGTQFVRVASHGFDAGFLDVAQSFPVTPSWAGRALRERRPLVSTDLEHEPDIAAERRQALLERGLRMGVTMPLHDHDTELGCLTLFYADDTVARGEQVELTTIEAVARTVSMAIAAADRRERLRRQATQDTLTGLANRHALLEALGQRLAATDAGPGPAVLLVDLDRFKEVNDTLGHAVGDQVLAALGARLGALADGRALLACRLGGDEFALLMQTVGSIEDALQRARIVREALSKPFDLGGMRMKLGASVGVAMYPQHGTDTTELLRAADVAMYRAKQRGLGVCVYERADDRHTADRLALALELPDALARGELVMHYQPKRRLGDGRIVGLEALVRWQHPTRGLLMPGAFIALAEASEVIHPFTRAVLDTTLADIRALRRRGVTQPVAVNLSARNLVDDRCVNDIERLVGIHGLAYTDLEVEITETALMHEPEQVARLLHRLDAHGVGLSLDDFGTGYSSLAHLKRLPLDALKVDRSFVRDIVTDEHDAIIVRSTIALAHSLGLQVVAEGVEDEATERALHAMGCDVVQGYHIARPMPFEALVHWMQVAGRAAGIDAARESTTEPV